MKVRFVFPSFLAIIVLGIATTAGALQPPVINTPGDTFPPGSTLSTSTPIFTWSQVPGATGYGLYITNLTDNVVVYPNLSGVIIPLTNSPFILPGGYLPGGKSYACGMTTFSGAAQSAPSSPRYFQTSLTSIQPPAVTAGTFATINSFIANWRTVFGMTNYVVDVSSSSTFRSFVNGGLNIQAGTNTFITIGGLNSGTTYYYRVRAYSITGTSDNSQTVAITTLPSAQPVPSASAATEVTTNSFRANWGFAINALGYLVDISPDPNFNTFINGGQNMNVGNNLSVVISGLTTNTAYYYRVRAINQGGTSSASSVISVTTLAPPVPAAPIALAPASVTDVSFTATWTIVTGATGYYLDVSTSSTFATFVIGLQNLDVGTSTNKSVTGLKGGTAYYYRLRARNGNGAGASSNIATATTQPPTLLVTPQKTGFVLSWPTNDSAYKLYYATNFPPNPWVLNPGTPKIVSGRYTLTNSVTTGAKLFRLKR